jgi:beta-glucosidase
MWFSKVASVVAGAMILAGCGRSGMPQAAADQKATTFKTASVPAGFLWGVSTAGQQYEGSETTSQWYPWWANGHTEDKNPLGANGFKMYGQDNQLTAGLGCNALRTSIEWCRIEPKPGVIDPEAVAHYHRVLADMKKNGLTPVITLHHFAHPQWVEAQGGWENAKTAELFANFAAFVAKEYANEIELYLTFNEPNTYVLGAYLGKAFPPGKQDPIAAVKVLKNMARGHMLAYDAVHENDPTAKVSFNMYYAEWVLGRSHTSEQRVAERVGSEQGFFDEVTNVRGRDGGKVMDYAALDYYCKFHISVPFSMPRADKWDIYPEGFYKAIKRCYQFYHLPVLVAENGVSTWNGEAREDGWTRSRYLVTHIKQMQRAMAEGIPVMGYIHWSITDNWEWGSFGPTFGLYRVDCRNQNFKRVPAEGADAFRSIVKSGGVNKDIEARYGILPAPWVENPNGGTWVSTK